MKTLAFAFSLALVGISFPTSSLLHAQTVTPTGTAYSFGSIDVCPAGKATPAPCSANHTVSFNVAAGTTIGRIDIVLQGAPDLDYKAQANDTSTTLCTAKLYDQATTCTVDVTFAPIAPGARNGAVEILGGNGALLATSYISGTGIGPQIAFSPSAQVLYGLGGNGQYGPEAATVDGSGNLFVIANGNQSDFGLEEITAASDYNSGKFLTTLDGVAAVALDGGGNLFVLDTPFDQDHQEVRELFAAGDYTSTKIVLKNADFASVAVDGAGNLFFDSDEDNAVLEYQAAGGYATGKILANVAEPTGLAVDGSGNIFVTSFYKNTVKEIVAAGGYTTIKTLGSNIAGPDYIAVDAAGNVFVTAYASTENSDNFALLEIVAAGGYTTVNTVSTMPVLYGFALCVDGYGNIFTNSGNKILELRRSQPPSLQFAPTSVDSTSSDSPLPVTAQNIGNATLSGSGLVFSDSDDFIRAAGSGAPPDCTASFSLAPSAQCNIGIDFTPESGGTLSGSVLLTDNSGNATAATQSIALSGNGITAGGPVAHVSATALNYGSIAFPGTATKSLTITNTGGGKLTISASVSSLNYRVTGNTCSGGITTGSCTIQVEFTPTSIGPQPNHLTLATNGPTNPTIALTGTSTGVGAVVSNQIIGGVLQPITSIDFGTIYFPTSSVFYQLVNFAVYDAGVGGPVTVQTSIDGPDYQVTDNNCISPGIKPSVFCIIQVEFSPLTLGGHYEHLTITPSVGAPSIIELIGTARGTVP